MKTNYKSITLAPFTYLTPSLNNISITFIIVLIPQIVMLAITKSYNSLLLLLVAEIASVLAEIIHNSLQNKPLFSNTICFLQGLLIGFFIPSGYPAIPTFFIVIITLFLVKYVFGGSFNSWLNPVVVTVIMLYFIGSTFFPSFLITISDIESGQPALNLFANGSIPIISSDLKITTWLNTKIFNAIGIEIPEGYVSLFWDNGSIIPAFRFNLLTLFASLVLISLNMLNSIIPFIFLCVYAVLIRFFGLYPYGGILGQGDVLLALMTSGTLFSCFFLLDWFGTTPLSLTGKIIYGFLAGFLAYFIVGCGTSPIGTMFTILCINIISPLIQLIENWIYDLQNKRAW